MSIASVLWILAMSGLVTGVAGAAAAALRRLHRPERWVWILALGVAAALPFLPAPTPVAVQASDAPAATTRGIPIAQVMTMASSSLPEPTRVSIPWIPLLWAAGSAATVLLMLGGAWTLARRRERWPRRRVDGDLLRISDRFGPAVVGWIDPEIVLPEWAVDLDQRPRRLILRHENEHRWANDPQLLALGVLLLAAAPWNPFAWLQFRGLRRAVEFDCDARVLGSGASPRAYGRLLLSVQLDGGRGVLFAPALREPASFLERRLQTMKLRDRPVARLRVAGLALVAVMLTVVACETPRPTESERGTNPAAAESATAPIQIAPTTFYSWSNLSIDSIVSEMRQDGSPRLIQGGAETLPVSELLDLEYDVDGDITSSRPDDYGPDEFDSWTIVVGPEAASARVQIARPDRLYAVDLPPGYVEVDLRDVGRDELGFTPDGLVFTVDANGAVRVVHSDRPDEVQTIAPNQVGGVWRHNAEDDPNLVAIIRANVDARYGVIDEVQDQLKAAGATRVLFESVEDTREAPQVEVVEAPPDLPSKTDRCADGSAPREIRPTGDVNPGLMVRGCLTDEPVTIREDRRPERESREVPNSIELWRPDEDGNLRLRSDTVRVRGLGSIRADPDGGTPLIYLDGVRVDPDAQNEIFDGLRPADILRVEVIKGTAARTLYGEDARSGVIQIFTKAGG